MIRLRFAGALAGALFALSVSVAHAQDRAAALARVKPDLNVADPLQRLANMEAILARNDALLTDLAIREAAGSADAQMRGLAMRTYIARAKQLRFEVKPPDEIARRYDELTGKPDELRKLISQHPYLDRLRGVNFRVTFDVTEYDLKAGRGLLNNLTGRSGVDPSYTTAFQIAGDRMSARIKTAFGVSASYCTYDIRPAAQLRLAGTMACESSEFPRQLRIESEMF